MIRVMSRSDVPTVATLERDIYPQPWSARVFFDELGHANRSYVVATEGDEIVGYGCFMLVESDAHITTLSVTPSQRRRRLGTRILLALVERAVGRGARHLTLAIVMWALDIDAEEYGTRLDEIRSDIKAASA